MKIPKYIYTQKIKTKLFIDAFPFFFCYLEAVYIFLKDNVKTSSNIVHFTKL